MKAIVSAALLAVIVSGCDPMSEEEQFRSALPTSDAVALKVPESSLSAQKGAPARKGAGNTAFFYQVTRGTTALLNGGTALVLGLVDAIVHHPPTSLTEDSAVWGPHTDPLSPNTWKLTVTRTSPNHYAYALEGKGKADSDDAYVTVLSGTHVPAQTARGWPIRHYGEGTFLLDWTAASSLPEHDANRGTVEVSYSRVSNTSPIQIDMQLTGVREDPNAEPANAQYRYDATPGQGGAFSFVANGDVDIDPAKTALEQLGIRSRWLESGAGRSDAQISGGDFTSATTSSECWDTAFISRFFAFNGLPLYGVEATDCAFVSAEFSP